MNGIDHSHLKTPCGKPLFNCKLNPTPEPVVPKPQVCTERTEKMKKLSEDLMSGKISKNSDEFKRIMRDIIPDRRTIL